MPASPIRPEAVIRRSCIPCPSLIVQKSVEAAHGDPALTTLAEVTQISRVRRDYGLGMIFSELRSLSLAGELAEHYGRILELHCDDAPIWSFRTTETLLSLR